MGDDDGANAQLQQARHEDPRRERTQGEGAQPCIFRQQDALLAAVGRVDALVKGLSC